ncbi:MAG: VWA domain-containing protein [Spirochaetes bacterium]|nr:VWA domain-containing protein [Spirochaetota bacterium]
MNKTIQRRSALLIRSLLSSTMLFLFILFTSCYVADDRSPKIEEAAMLGMAGKAASLLVANDGAVAAALRPGESVTVSKTVTITGSVPKADILFVFDVTGSMDAELAQMKTNAIAIMNNLDTLISDAQYGVISFKDYVGYLSSCGYYGNYGSSGDYPYRLDQNLTDNRALVQVAINGLTTGGGADIPESYSRVMYEAYSDPAITYRSGSKRILVMFGDAVPHDCDLNEGVPGLTTVNSTGKDPGRDGLLDTADDLDLQEVLAGVAASDITLLMIYSGGTSDMTLWKHWSGLTGGDAYQLTTASEIPAAIKQLIENELLHIDELTLKVTTPGYEDWLTSVTPVSYTDITIEGTMEFTFEYVLTVPLDACASGETATRDFMVSAMGDGANYGDDNVAITVLCSDPMETFNVTIFMAADKNWCGKPIDRILGLGSLRLADSGEAFDPETDDVVLTANDVEILIPAGSFRKQHWLRRHSQNVFTYNGRIAGVGHVAMVLNFKMRFWKIAVYGGEAAGLVSGDTVNVRLDIGNNVGEDNFAWTKKWSIDDSSFALYIERHPPHHHTKHCKKK